MKRLGLPMDRVKAIFVSHEHADHINGIPVLAKKYQLPVYMTPETCKQGKLTLNASQVISFTSHQSIRLGNLDITAFPKYHDACDPHSFIISHQGIKVGVFTDIGFPCAQVIQQFQQCDAAFLEANYDEAMLENGSYPYHLKKRISGNQGHLSNTQALELFTKYRPANMSHLVLSHLSKNNNSPEIVGELFVKHANQTHIIVASRYVETPIYQIMGKTMQEAHVKARRTSPQLSLF